MSEIKTANEWVKENPIKFPIMNQADLVYQMNRYLRHFQPNINLLEYKSQSLPVENKNEVETDPEIKQAVEEWCNEMGEMNTNTVTDDSTHKRIIAENDAKYNPGSQIGILKQYDVNNMASKRGYEYRISELQKELETFKDAYIERNDAYNKLVEENWIFQNKITELEKQIDLMNTQHP